VTVTGDDVLTVIKLGVGTGVPTVGVVVAEERFADGVPLVMTWAVDAGDGGPVVGAIDGGRVACCA
jgi:hypothetical protein